MNGDMMNLRLMAIRKSKGWTQAQFAKQIGASENSVRNWENGRFTPPFDTVLRIANLLDVSIDFLVGRSDHSVHPTDASQQITREQWPIMQDTPVWITSNDGRVAAWAFVDAAHQRFFLADGSTIPFQGFQGAVRSLPPDFICSMRGAGTPLSNEELLTGASVWVEPISPITEYRNELRGWYQVHDKFVRNEVGNCFYRCFYGAKWVAYREPGVPTVEP